MEQFLWILLGTIFGAVASLLFRRFVRQGVGATDRPKVSKLIAAHFHPTPLDGIAISERRFPHRVRVDLQRSIDRLFNENATVSHFCGVRQQFSHEAINLPECMAASKHNPVDSVPPQYEAIDIGEKEPVRGLKNGLWFCQQGKLKFIVLLAQAGRFRESPGVQFQIATPNTREGTQLSQEFFQRLEDSVFKAESYRGKILSLERSEHSYSGFLAGESSGIKVHKLRTVERDQIILPAKTLELLERNVIQFVRQRSQLAKFRVATRKGILFYGPPGTGKTHTIHYLAKALEGHTTLLISAEQFGLLSEYMTLARLMQPSMVVMEDVDLIAKDRLDQRSCGEVLLNRLLNEMDGLNEEADILFILTTNRPEMLESALASRPGRVDQAIEFPLPNEEGRQKLVRLYSQGIETSDEVVRSIVLITARVSAAFIKELMRRTVQFRIGRNGAGSVELQDVENALDEMLFSGGSLNAKLLGAEVREPVGFGAHTEP